MPSLVICRHVIAIDGLKSLAARFSNSPDVGRVHVTWLEELLRTSKHEDASRLVEDIIVGRYTTTHQLHAPQHISYTHHTISAACTTHHRCFISKRVVRFVLYFIEELANCRTCHHFDTAQVTTLESHWICQAKNNST